MKKESGHRSAKPLSSMGALFCWSLLLSMIVPRALAADALSGNWILNRERSHYGPSAQSRTRETFDCQPVSGSMKCAIRSLMNDGRTITGGFAAAFNGKPHPTTGIPDVDQVILRRVSDSIADATFSLKGRPVFAYRAIKSDNGKSLTIISVEPITREVLTSVVMYDRR